MIIVIMMMIMIIIIIIHVIIIMMIILVGNISLLNDFAFGNRLPNKYFNIYNNLNWASL